MVLSLLFLVVERYFAYYKKVIRIRKIILVAQDLLLAVGLVLAALGLQIIPEGYLRT